MMSLRLNIVTLNYVLRIQIVSYFGLKLPICIKTIRIWHFDTSNYPTDQPLFNLTNKAVPGLTKEEFAGKFASEFCGLRRKLYSCKVHVADGKMAAAEVKHKVARRHYYNMRNINVFCSVERK